MRGGRDVVPDQSQTLVFALVIGAVGFGIFHSFFSHTDWYKRWVWIPAIGFAVTFAAVYFAKFDDCTRYPICWNGWAEGQPVPTIEAKVEAGPLIDAIDLQAKPKPVVSSVNVPTAPVEQESRTAERAVAAPAPRDKPADAMPLPAKSPPARSAEKNVARGTDPICPVGLVCTPAPGQRSSDKPQPTAVAAWSMSPAADPLAGLKASLKGELRRLNCLKGGDEASWGKDTVSAINRFNVYGYTKASVEPDEETLQMLKGVKEPVCP